MQTAIIFYILATIIVLSSLLTVFVANPVFSALFLAITMINLAFVFFQLQAFFIGGVQLIVYAGAVMVLFVMVLMLFDLRKETQSLSPGPIKNLVKAASAGMFCGLIGGVIYMSTETLLTSSAYGSVAPHATPTKDLAEILFTQYLFAFEALGLLLLLVAIGAVAVARTKGGTHAHPR